MGTKLKLSGADMLMHALMTRVELIFGYPGGAVLFMMLYLDKTK